MINIIIWAALVIGATWLIIKVVHKYWNDDDQGSSNKKQNKKEKNK